MEELDQTEELKVITELRKVIKSHLKTY